MRVMGILFLKSVLCLCLIASSCMAFVGTFAYISGNSLDRATMETELLVRLHAWRIKSDQQLHAWLNQAHGEKHDQQIVATFASYAVKRPDWFRGFVASLKSPERAALLIRMRTVMTEPNEQAEFEQIYGFSVNELPYRLGSR